MLSKEFTRSSCSTEKSETDEAEEEFSANFFFMLLMTNT